MRKCKDCGKADALSDRNPRCTSCFKLWNRLRARKLRDEHRRILARDNPKLLKLGYQICGECHHKRVLTEYGTSLSNRQGKLNKICDKCLSAIYKYKGKGLDYCFWRRRAYGSNKAASIRLSRVRRRHTSLDELPWVCKPQDLLSLFERQHGKCFYCQRELVADDLNVDHSVPLSRDGKHALNNLTLTCRSCNLLKWDRTMSEFPAFAVDYAKRLLLRATELSDKEPAG